MDHRSAEFPEVPSISDTEKQGSDRIFVCELLEDLKAVNPLWHDVIDCICVREMKLEEACEYLGIPPGVLRGRLHRARHYIKVKYGKEW